MFYQISLSPQVKQWAIVTYNKHGINELPYQLPNNLPAAHTRKMTQDPRKLGNTRKVPRPDRTISPAPRPCKDPRNTATEPSPPPRRATPHENQSRPQITRNRLQNGIMLREIIQKWKVGFPWYLFSSAICLTHGQLWAILDETVSLTPC